jgi:hypothetical protein
VSGQSAPKYIAQKSALKGRLKLKIAREAAEIGSRQANVVSFWG